MGTGSSNNNSISGTAGSHDAGFNDGTDHQHSIRENLKSLKEKFDYKNGYFGTKGLGKGNRRIESDNPLKTARNFYKLASKGGEEEPMSNGKGVYSTMSDGTVISERLISSSDGSPAIEINIKKSIDSNDIKYQKIHFVTNGGKK